ncbi:trimeric intracellular cation channel family protein [Dietzia lutea]|uniref:Glycine transporter domain-containing protein n=1 Tax=Dietzia lutea TaxID=546160 RepID=A0A2S1RAF6_9ACTN|nr:TRIC cation channel family protein [Dietzia lutea]AWH93267.1 hypothetical protein A6035_14970 [Dietzia lutea]
METSPLVLWFDLMGVFFFALSGNLLAARKDIDITGGFILGLLAGLGGGIIRDVLLGVTPLALDKPVYLVPPLVAVVVVYLLGSVIHRVQTLIVACDAAGLGLFCTFGTARALDHGMPVASALLLGVVTAVGGGLMRDVVANEIPAVFSGSNLYVIPAATGATLTAVAVSTDVWGPVSATVLSVLVFTFRMTAWVRQWRVPAPVRSWTVRDLDVLRRRERSVFDRPRGARYDDDEYDDELGRRDDRDPGDSRGRGPRGRR